MTARPTAADRFVPYVPRLVAEWLEDSPGELYRGVDGTLVFIDISGFTRLSERLAMKGREGSEEVTGFLNLSFGAMLELAATEGGDLLKYGGDALLLLFRGPGHAVRACRMVHAARRGLREARVGASTGVAPLRMSVGVHSGRFDCFLVGESHRELVLTGPDASMTAEMEGIATAGEILVSGSTAEQLPRRVLGQAKGTGVLLARAPERSSGGLGAVMQNAAVGLEAAVPVALRPHLATASAAGEHRLATIGFVKYTGMDTLLRTGGAEAAAVALERLIAACQAAAAEYDVSFLSTDIDKDGGKVILTAGAPNAGEDETGRLLLAARRVVATECGLGIRVGVNRGYVFAGDVGGANRRAYTIIGDAVNLAARVMAKAEPGQVLATRETLASTPMTFALTPLEPFAAKGKTALVAAAVVGEPGELTPSSGVRYPLVGREAELATLVAALERARAGAGSVVEVSGDGGIGKTRLVEELVSVAGEMPVYEARTGPYATRSAYFPFRRLLRSVMGMEPGDAADELRRRVVPTAPGLQAWLPLLGAVMDVPVTETRETAALGSRFRTVRLHRAVGELLEAFVPGPAIFVFEDTAWHDPATRELLHELLRGGAERPWLFVVTAREADAERTALPACTCLPLAALDREAALQLARHATGGDGRGRQLQAVVERAAGNPLFLLELITAAASGRALDDLPGSVESLVAARIDELSPSGRQLVRYAAVVGAAFDPADVLAAFEEGELGPVALGFEQLGGFLERDGGGGYRFRHRLYREAAYEGLPFRTRRRLHARLVDLYERRAGEEAAELIAVHAARANDHERSWRYGVMAAERAQAKFANLEAAELFAQALRAARFVPGVEPLAIAQVAEARSDVLEVAGRYDGAAAGLAEARQHARGDSHSIVRLLRKQGLIHERTGAYRKALASLGRARSVLERASVAPGLNLERMQVLVGMGAVRFRQGRYASAADLCSRALEAMPDDPGGDRPTKTALAHAYYLLGHAQSFLGGARDGDLRLRALEIYEELGDYVGQANALNNLGIGAYYAGDLDRAIELWERSRAACAHAGDVIGEARQQNNIAEVLSDRGELDAAGAMFEAARETFHTAGYRIGEALTLSNLGRVATRAGKTSGAEAMLETALAMFREIGAASFAAEGEVRMIENLVAGKRWAEGVERAGDLLGRAAQDGAMARQESALSRLRATCYAGLGDRDAARRDLERALAVARERGSAPDEEAAVKALAPVTAATARP